MHLPLEIVSLIFDALHEPLHPRHLSAVNRVNKAWNALSTAKLYQDVVIYSPRSFHVFRATILARCALGRQVHSLRLMGDTDQDEVFTAEWIGEDAFFDAMDALASLKLFQTLILPFRVGLSPRVLKARAFKTIQTIRFGQSRLWRVRQALEFAYRDVILNMSSILQLPTLRVLDLGPFLLEADMLAKPILLTRPSSLTFLQLATTQMGVKQICDVMRQCTGPQTRTIDLKLVISQEEDPVRSLSAIFEALPPALTNFYLHFEPSQTANLTLLAAIHAQRLCEESLSKLPSSIKLLRIAGRFFTPRVFMMLPKHIDTLLVVIHFPLPTVLLEMMSLRLAEERAKSSEGRNKLRELRIYSCRGTKPDEAMKDRMRRVWENAGVLCKLVESSEEMRREGEMV